MFKRNEGGNIATFCMRFIVIALCFLFFTGCEQKKTIELDPFDNLKIEFKGFNGRGTATIEENIIEYSGNDETVERLIDSVRYDISPNKGLKNGDTVTVTVRYKKDLKNLSKASFTREEKTYKVKGLREEEKEVITNEETYTTKDGEEKQGYTQSYDVGGVKIPSDWNLTDEEISQYLDYLEEAQNSGDVPEQGAQIGWIQGESDENTNRKSADFLCKDYLNNSITTYNDAYRYGIESSQQFKIEPILENEETVGYRCVFKEG